MRTPLAAIFAVWLAFLAGAPVSAQDSARAPAQVTGDDPAGAPATLRLTVRVLGADGMAIPGATLRATETSSGRAWVSWSDQSGKLELAGLPAGHYRLETSQIGFATSRAEFDFSTAPVAAVDVKLEVATLSSLNASAPPSPGQAPPGQAGPSPVDMASAADSARTASRPGGPERPRRARPDSQPPDAETVSPTPAGRPPGRPGPPGGRQRGFDQLALNSDSMRADEVVAGQDSAAANLGDAAGGSSETFSGASSDALVMSGTVAQGAFGDDGGLGAGDGGSGAVDLGADESRAGVFRGFGGPDGSVGGGGFGGGGGGGGRGPGGPPRGRGGPPGGPRGVQALWGAQRVARQRINRVHFSAYNEYGNSALNARPYSLTENDPVKIPSWNERFGGNAGGPLKIPGVYDGTDRTFFFVNFQGGWSRNPIDQFATVPTDAERGGDFSARGVQLFDPVTHAPLGSSIPSGMLNPAAAGLLGYVPQANLPGVVNNYHLQARAPGATNRLSFNVQHTLSARFNLSVNYNVTNASSLAFQSFPSLERNLDTRGQSLMIGLTQNWTRSLVHDSRLYYSRNRVLALNRFAFNTDVAGQLGITGVSTDPIDYGVPQLGFANFSGVNDVAPSLARNQTFRYVDNLSIIRASHTVRTGFEIRRIETNLRTDPTPRGSFTFDGRATALLDSAGQPLAGTGFDLADFLLGLPQATSVRYGAASTYFRSWGYAAYAQDDWRITPRFTLQYGVRYEASTPPVELNGRFANLDVSPDFSQAQVVTPGQAGPYSGALPDSLLRGDYNNWAPRVGIAWQPPGEWFNGRNQTVVRAGYGVFYNGSIYPQLDAAMANQPPFAQAQTRQTSAATPLTLENGFPPAAPAVASNTVAVDPNYRVGYAQIWNLSLERQLPAGTSLNLTYTGTKGTALDLLLGFRQTAGGTGAGGVQNALGFIYDTSGASSTYHGFQVRLRRRMTRGLMLNGTYTYSKSIDNASSIGGGAQVMVQDNGDLDAERGLSSFDLRHQVRVNYVYELPFGERRRWATHGWQKTALESWRFSGSFTGNSGTPFTARVLSGSCAIIGGAFSARADQSGDPNLPGDARTTSQWFNTAAFSAPSGCIGGAARNSIAGPGLFAWNAALGKTVPLGRDGLRRLDFRLEVNNLLNRVNYTGLSTVVNSATFGSVTGAGAMRSMSFTTRVNF